MKKQYILILSNKNEPGVDRVVSYLRDLAQKIIRIDINTLFEDRMDLCILETVDGIEVSSGRLDFLFNVEEIKSIWYRRPENPVPIAEQTVGYDEQEIDFLRQEYPAFLWSLQTSLKGYDRNNFDAESNHKYSAEKYYSLLKHEISHAFYRILCDGQNKPIWLCEGVAIYTSGQNGEKRPIDRFKKFLDFYEDGGKGVYDESGFVVHILVNEFGKQKLLDLIKGLKSTSSQKDFAALFVQIYGCEPTYERFNELLKKYPLAVDILTI